MAFAFPGETKLSVGALLPLLIVGDVMTLRYYRQHAHWRKLVKLMPAVAVGMGLAFFFLAWISESVFRPFLGFLVLGMVGLELVRRKGGMKALPHRAAFAHAVGMLAGFATTIGNTAGPIMGVYFLSRGWVKERFMGATGWFFFTVNVSKIPILILAGMITRQSLLVDLVLAPLVIAGGLLGARLLPLIPPALFARLVLLLSAVSALRLIIQ